MARRERAEGQGAGSENGRGAAAGSRSRSRRIPREESVRDIMTAEPRALAPGASAMEAAQVMRDNDIGDVVVLEEERLYGIVTDRDIVVRVLAEQSDPSAVRLADICSRELTTIAPDASVGEAVRLIREKSVRRLPVVEEDGQVVGIVSFGELAISRERGSALADVSAAPANS